MLSKRGVKNLLNLITNYQIFFKERENKKQKGEMYE
jgi:hypothetical protein